MHRSLCALVDDSPHGRRAAAVALELAARGDARLTLLHADPGATASLRRARLASTLPASLAPGASDAAAASSGQASGPSQLMNAFAEVAKARKVPCEVRVVAGRAVDVLPALIASEGYDLVVAGAVGAGSDGTRQLGTTIERLLRKLRTDVLVVRDLENGVLGSQGTLLVCIDGSPQSHASLLGAIEMGKRLERKIEAVAVYDPYLHYTLFNGIVGVLSEKASKVFKFKDQEKLHEEIIDTGLAKIYQAHLEVARGVALERGVELQITLLDGKAHQKVLKHSYRTSPALVLIGRVGVHSEDTMDIGATAENLLRMCPCDVLVTSRAFTPPVDLRAAESVQWLAEAEKKMERVPSFVRGVARTAIIRWAIERGHSIITPGVINACMGDILPPSAAQAMGYVAEDLAKTDAAANPQSRSYLCSECGYASRDYRPVACPVCKAGTDRFEAIDRDVIASIGELERGDIEIEETFDGKRLAWTDGAKSVLRRVPNGYERRRAKARIEKTAKVRGLTGVDEAFAIDMVEQEMANTSYLSTRGERLTVEVKKNEQPDDATARSREESSLPWTDAAWKRIERVPAGFMRDMTREKVEQFAAGKSLVEVNLALCEEGIAEGRRMMAEMIGSYGKGGATQDVLRQQVAKSPAVTAASSSEEPAPAWTEGAEKKAAEATVRAVESQKFTEDRAEELVKNVTEQRAREKRLEAIGEAFMTTLGKKLGYGHPLSQLTAEHQFTWMPEALAELENVPAFCREMTKWRVEWTAVKKDLGRTITPEIMKLKYDMWGEVSDAIQERDDNDKLAWDDSTSARLARIPDFVRGQVIESVEGNARRWGIDRVTDDVLDRVIQKWVETGDFHESRYGYK